MEADDCLGGIEAGGVIVKKLRVLNLYAGLGGNRKRWTNCEVVAVERNPEIAAIYKRLYPGDLVKIADAHEWLIDYYAGFDFIWSSPPCQTHSRMTKATRHKIDRYIDLSLYEEILFLQQNFRGLFVVENVVPFYSPLIPPTKRVGRHLFWSSFEFDCDDVERPKGFINKCNLAGKKALQDWLDIHYEENIYYGDNHCPAQILRNCVHPKIGEQIFNSARNILNT